MNEVKCDMTKMKYKEHKIQRSKVTVVQASTGIRLTSNTDETGWQTGIH